MIWKNAKGRDHVSFKVCPGTCLEMIRTHLPSTGHGCSQLRQIARGEKLGRNMKC
jgi:hypothetical protein